MLLLVAAKIMWYISNKCLMGTGKSHKKLNFQVCLCRQMIISKEWLQCCLAALFSYVFSSMKLSGHHVSVWHYQWEVLWQHQELDTEYRRGKILYWCVCILESILGIDRLQRALESAQLWAHFVADSFPVCSLCQPSFHSTLQQMWKGWSLGTNVMSMISDKYPKTEERRW